MDFVESIQAEGVVLERKPMGEGTGPKTPLVVEIDNENSKKDLDALDIEIPVLTPRTYREYKNLGDLNTNVMGHQKAAYLQFSDEEQREIVFKDITTGEVTHTTILDTAGIGDYRSVIGYFAQTIPLWLKIRGISSPSKASSTALSAIATLNSCLPVSSKIAVTSSLMPRTILR